MELDENSACLKSKSPLISRGIELCLVYFQELKSRFQIKINFIGGELNVPAESNIPADQEVKS